MKRAKPTFPPSLSFHFRTTIREGMEKVVRNMIKPFANSRDSWHNYLLL